MAAAALLAAGLVAYQTAPIPTSNAVAPAQPLFHGLTLDEWRERMNQLHSEDPGSASAVPGLVALVQSGDVPWFTRRQAALTLGRLGPHAVAAIPALRGLLNEMGPDPETAPQLWAIKALGLLGPRAREATPQLIAILNNDAAPFASRLSVLEALSRIASDEPQAVSALIDRVQQAPTAPVDHELRRAAIEVLGLLGPSASAATPVLMRLLDDPDEHVRREAAASLGKLGPLAGSAAPALVECMAFDESAAVQDAAALALQQMGASISAEVLLPLLAAEDAELRRRAATIFGAWHHAAAPWLSTLRPLWDDPDPAVRLAALEAAWNIERAGDAIAPRLASLIGEDDRHLRRQAVALLDRMGDAADTARPVLERLLDDPRPNVRTAARKALEAIGRGVHGSF